MCGRNRRIGHRAIFQKSVLIYWGILSAHGCVRVRLTLRCFRMLWDIGISALQWKLTQRHSEIRRLRLWGRSMGHSKSRNPTAPTVFRLQWCKMNRQQVLHQFLHHLSEKICRDMRRYRKWKNLGTVAIEGFERFWKERGGRVYLRALKVQERAAKGLKGPVFPTVWGLVPICTNEKLHHFYTI